MNLCKCGIAALDCEYHREGEMMAKTIAYTEAIITFPAEIEHYSIAYSSRPSPCDRCGGPIGKDELHQVEETGMLPVRGLNNQIIGWTSSRRIYTHHRCPSA